MDKVSSRPWLILGGHKKCKSILCFHLTAKEANTITFWQPDFKKPTTITPSHLSFFSHLQVQEASLTVTETKQTGTSYCLYCYHSSIVFYSLCLEDSTKIISYCLLLSVICCSVIRKCGEKGSLCFHLLWHLRFFMLSNIGKWGKKPKQ